MPTFDSIPPVPDSPDVVGGFEAGASIEEEDDETEDDGEAWADPINLSTDDGDEWGAAWAETSVPDVSVSAEEPPDEWEAARQEKEKLNRSVPPETMASLIQKCQEVSGELWPGMEFHSDVAQSNWRTGFDGLENITALLNDLVPEDVALPPPIQFSQTATVKAVNNALKLTRHMPLTRKSPMALLLSSKGSTDWEKSVKARKDIFVDDAPVGWRILEKDESAAITDASQPKKSGAGLLSFWNRKASSSIPYTDSKVENARSSPIPGRSSAENTKPQVPERRDTSPARTPAVFMDSPPVASSSTTPDIVIPAVTPAPSAVSRFLNRFSRAKGTGSERKSLALSTDDLDFLSDIVPSAHDPDDDTDDAQLKALSNLINSNPTSLPTKLPPPLAPPPKPPSPYLNTSRPPSVAGLSGLGIALEPASGSPQPTSARGLFLPPPLSPVTGMSFSRPHSPAVPPKPSSPINATFSAYTNPKIPAAIPSPPQPSLRTHSPFQLPPPLKAPSALSIPPLLPPPPVSPPQTPRPVVHSIPAATSFTSSPNSSWAAATYQDDDDDDDSFSAFSALPRTDPFPRPRESIDSSLNSPSSTQALNSGKSSTSMSFDDFDEFITSSRIRTPSPPPVPAKPSKVVGGAGAGMSSSRSGTSMHVRTQSLLDHAATQRGQWPSPPRAHMHPVLPPPSASPSFGRDMDLLSDGGAALSAPRYGSPPPKVQSMMVPQMSPSPPPAPLSQPLLTFASLSPSSSRAERPPAKPVNTGGLTAQDLSFFEGL
ncbi:hypothetical protein DEU56DRAFT_873653 [Suillus clintonianus]|uniref:uncharacterized protein n=1 Tax=Suillus clintonianus TaxID=1904413 RepID=UPI001B879016|nr:uncharacterized protein DEU56DRAFT_873653 [Suillus clintonianus]KAG2122103.1 hypothetical protein DEU56DRAFT_873653 [Suillus clintonianus]